MNLHQEIPEDWLELVQKAWTSERLNSWLDHMGSLLEKEDITPEFNRIFYALEQCSFDKTKVLILGQDPYPTAGHANGLAFSTEDFVQPFPKSLLNIFKELKRSIEDYDFPLTGNLSPWTNQGVLLLNTCLTTRKGESNAHKNKGWEDFTHTLLSELFRQKKNIVGMFWGKQSQELAKKLNKTDHLFLESSHPSPLSVYRGFDGCNHFTLCNDYLLKNGQNPIDWQT